MTALLPAITARGGLWLGWSGRLVPPAQRRLSLRHCGTVQHALLDLAHQEHQRHYLHFCNQQLWPLLHGLAPPVPLQAGDWEAYRSVNRRFARHLAPLLRAGDRVWIHDYHLIPLAAELRALGVDQRLGFFLHTPFPPTDTWLRLPQAALLLRLLQACDLVGVQTRPDAARLRAAALSAGAGALCDRVGVFPASIATAELARGAAGAAGKSPPGLPQPCGRFILGVDRLDPSKGVAQRLAGFDAFLRHYRSDRERIALLQVLPDSRTAVPQYRVLRSCLQAQVAALNVRHGRAGWTPVQLHPQHVDASTLARLYRAAPVALVTPLRDGMNLVAKEYVAAQDARDPGVLVLSRHAGAAQELGGALLVEPADALDIAGALDRALSLPLGERRVRWQGMYQRLLRHDATAWADDFLRALDAAPRWASPPEPDPWGEAAPGGCEKSGSCIGS